MEFVLFTKTANEWRYSVGTAYMVRHFETESNTQGLFGDGPLDDVATNRGKGQTVLTAVYLAKLLKGADVHYFSGESRRNCLTAFNIWKAEGNEFGWEDLHHSHAELDEQHPGEWRGKSKNAIDPQLLADWRSGKYKVPGAELDREFEARVLDFWNKEALPPLQEGKNLLIATSGNPIRVILAAIWRLPWRHLLPALVVDNCGITTIKVNAKGQCFVGPVNDISHLEGVGVTPIPGT